MVIYSIKNINNGNEYIGQTIMNPNRHWTGYKYQLNKNKFHNKYLQNAWNKYGKESFVFEVIDLSAKTNHELNELEIKYIKERGKYNMLPGGDNTSAKSRELISECTKLAMTKEVREKISKSRKGKPAWNLGLKYDSPKIRGLNNPTKRYEVKLKMSKNHADVSGDKNPNSKLSNDDINKIILLYSNSDKKGKEIAYIFNISYGHLLRMMKKNKIRRYKK